MTTSSSSSYDDEDRQRSSGSAILAVAAVTLANGGDNLAVYVPLFSGRPVVEVAAMIGAFLVLTLALCAAGHLLVSHPTLGGPIRRYARVVTPIVLIALGVWILVESRAYTLMWPS